MRQEFDGRLAPACEALGNEANLVVIRYSIIAYFSYKYLPIPAIIDEACVEDILFFFNTDEGHR